MAQVSSTPLKKSTRATNTSNSTNSTTFPFTATWSTTTFGKSTTETTIAQTTTVLDTTTTTIISTPTTSTAELNTTQYVIAKKDDSKGPMHPGGYAGIGISCLVVFIMLIIIIFVLIRRKRRRRRKSPGPNFVPKLPAASDVDKTIQKVKGNNGGKSPSYDIERDAATAQSETDFDAQLYRNIDKDGNPSDETNPNVGEDGYLQKFSKAVLHKKKKEGRKKKIKNKFNKKKKKSKLQDNNELDDFESETEKSSHGYVNKTDNSNIGYSEGRAAEGHKKGYSSVTDLGKRQNETELYENTSNPNARYANLPNVQSDSAVTKDRFYNQQQDTDAMQQIYENM